MLDPHGLPQGPPWLEQLRRVKKVAAIGEGLAYEIVEYVDALRAAAWPIVRALEDVGDRDNWDLGDETDRMYPWYEIEPLKRAVLGSRAG